LRTPQARIRRTRRGRFQLRLPAQERDLLRTLPRQLVTLLGTDDPSLVRLRPPAYADDSAAETEYRRLVDDDLTTSRRRALEVMERTVDARELDEQEMAAWLAALNDLRLVLGTRLDVTEETDFDDFPKDDDRATQFVLYVYLGWLQEQAVEALAQGLPRPSPTGG
jgi:hypothetical protein